MATIKSDLYAIQDGTSAPTKAAMGNVNGRMRNMYFEVTGVAVIATTDFVKLCKLPAGARVVDWKISIPDVGSTGTFKIGWAASVNGAEIADDDGFGAATAFTSSGTALAVPVGADAGLFKKFVAEVDVQIVPTVATDVGAVTIKGHFQYVID